MLQLTLAALVLGLAATGLLFPSTVPKVPTAGSDAAYTLLGVGLLFCALLAHRATRTHWLTRRPADLLLLCLYRHLAQHLGQLVFEPPSTATAV